MGVLFWSPGLVLVELEGLFLKFPHQFIMHPMYLRPELLRSYKPQPALDFRPHLEAEAVPLRLQDDAGHEAVCHGEAVACEELLVLEVARLETLQLLGQVTHTVLNQLLVRFLRLQAVLVETARVGEIVASTSATPSISFGN